MSKHKLKLLLRGAYARLLYHTGLARVVDRLMPARLTILAGHCVADEGTNGGLPADMKISAAKLEEVLGFLGKRYELCTVGEGVRAFESGSAGRSRVALSMDDGYRDNRTVLLPLLEKLGGKVTVFLESRPLDERKVNWSHKYFWLLGELDAEELARQYMARATDADTNEKLRRLLEDPGADLDYLVKRVLKYEAPQDDRETALSALFKEKGGDERALCDRIYMTWDDARELQARGVELGGHTVNHFILSTLSVDEAESEVARGRDALRRELGEEATRTFAYPFGRHWDFNDESAQAVEKSGFASAVTTHSGTNGPDTDRYRLARWMIDEDTPLHVLAAEACGGFELLRRFGLNLSE